MEVDAPRRAGLSWPLPLLSEMSADKQRRPASPDVTRRPVAEASLLKSYDGARSAARGADISRQSVGRRRADTDGDSDTWDEEQSETAALAGSRG